MGERNDSYGAHPEHVKRRKNSIFRFYVRAVEHLSNVIYRKSRIKLEMRKVMHHTATRLLFLLIAGIVTLMLQEGLARSGVEKAVNWVIAYPQLAFLNLILIYSVMCLSVSAFGKVFAGLVASFFLLVTMSFINHMKTVYLHQPFFAWDLLYYEHMYVLLPRLPIRHLSHSLLIPALGLPTLLIFGTARAEKSVRIGSRLLMALLPLFLLGSFVYHREIPKDIPAFFSTENAVWDQRSNYDKNGFLLAFTWNIQPMLISEPPGYSEEAVQELLRNAISPKYRKAPAKTALQPINLVLFVNESFYDLLHVKYEADENPLENFQKTLTRFPTFRMVSPSFGGNTSNAEFEMLTGMSNAFLPSGAIPFDHYIREEIPSLVSVLRDNGYRTIAIHPYYDWFWNRKLVYPKLGFQEFISLADFEGAKYRGWFVSDEALVDRVIDRIEKSSGPYFVHALSMQNHGSYDPRRYAPDEVEIRADYPNTLKLALQTYVTGIRDADRQLARLLEYLESRPEPIVSLFCGDHLPSFGPEYAVYRESGTVQSSPGEYTLEEHFNMSSVPCLLWANKKDLLDTRSIPKHISPIYFPPVLLRQLKIEMPGYYRYLYQGMRDYPVIHSDVLWKPDGTLTSFDSERDSRFLLGLELLQYDTLFGQRYSQ
jgi:phosphoglycerol transferase MdoB-like AlkP superfamily enzyme